MSFCQVLFIIDDQFDILLQASPHLDLSEFLVENQGKRCVVVLDVSPSVASEIIDGCNVLIHMNRRRSKKWTTPNH